MIYSNALDRSRIFSFCPDKKFISKAFKNINKTFQYYQSIIPDSLVFCHHFSSKIFVFWKHFFTPRRLWSSVSNSSLDIFVIILNNNNIYFRTKCLQICNYNIEKRNINPRPEDSWIRPENSDSFIKGLFLFEIQN